MARRSFLRVAGVIENMSAFTCEHGDVVRALRRGGGGQTLADEIGVELLGQVPIESAVAAGGDAGEPVVLDGTGPAADAFRAIAGHIVTETVPPVAMAGCSARLLDAVEAAALGPAAAPTDVAAPASVACPRGASVVHRRQRLVVRRRWAGPTSMRPSPSAAASAGSLVGGRTLRGPADASSAVACGSGSRFGRRRDHGQLPRSACASVAGRTHRLAMVSWSSCKGSCACGAGGDEEPRVEPPSFADRRDPVADVVDVIRREAQPFEGAQLDQPRSPAMHGGPVGQYRSSSAGSSKRTGWPSGWRSQQDAGLLEALPDGGDPVPAPRLRSRAAGWPHRR